MKRVEIEGIVWHRFVLFVLVVQPLIFYRKHLIRQIAHIPFDIQGFHLPLATFLEHALQQGVLPFWNPFTYCGVPIHADITAQVFYPPTWLAIGMDLATGAGRLFYWLHVSTALHMAIAGLGAYFLLRKLACSPLAAFFGATVFQLGPFFASQAEHFGSICAAAWFPWILLSLVHLGEGFRKRWLGVLALCTGMGILSGFPQTVISELGLAAVFCLVLIGSKGAPARLILQFLSGCALGFGIAAIQLIPTLQLSGLSIASLRYEWLRSSGGMPWQALVSFVWPNYYHIFEPWDARYTLPYDFTTLYTFCGYITIVLIVLAPVFFRKSRMIAASVGLWILSAIWMLGHNTPIYTVLFRFLPRTVQGASYPETALLGFSLFAAMTASFVLGALRPKLPLPALVLLVAANSWNLCRVSGNKAFNAFPGSYAEATAGWIEHGTQLPAGLCEMTAISTPPVRIDFLWRNDFTFREVTDSLGFHSAGGDNPFLLQRYYDVRRQFLNDGDSSRRLYFRDLDNPWIKALNIGYLIDNLDRERPAEDSYELLPFEKVRIYKVKDPIPRYYLQSRIWSASTEQEARARIQDRAFDPLQETVVEDLPAGWTPDPTATGSVRIVRYENNRVELAVQSSGRAILASSEILYPGWTVLVNGKPADLLHVNLAFRGLPVDSGESHIVMQYFPEKFFLPLAVTMASLIATGLLLLRP
jgi:hypothetical protein